MRAAKGYVPLTIYCSWCWGLFWKAEYLHVTVAVGGPFEKQSICTLQLLLEARLKSKVLTHYGYCWRPFRKAEYLHITVASGAPLNAEYLKITTVVGPFESRVLTHYSCYCGPLWKQRTYDVLRNILYEWIIRVSPKWGKFSRETPRGGP